MRRIKWLWGLIGSATINYSCATGQETYFSSNPEVTDAAVASEDAGPAAGTEGGKCLKNNQCEDPLICLDNMCIYWPDETTIANDPTIAAPDAGPNTVRSNSASPISATIAEIKAGQIADGTYVILHDVQVTAVDSYGPTAGDLFVQETINGQVSGLFLYKPRRVDGGKLYDLKAGDRLHVQGPVKVYQPNPPFNDPAHPNKKTLIELGYGTRVVRLGAGIAPTPTAISAKELQRETLIEKYEDTLITVDQLTVPDVLENGEFTTYEGVLVDDELSNVVATPGECLNVTGVWSFMYRYRLMPRTTEDIKASSRCGETVSVTIKDLQNSASRNHPGIGSIVKTMGVITAVDSVKSGPVGAQNYTGFFIQSPEGDLFSGIYVYYSWNDGSSNKPQIGQRIEITGLYNGYNGINELRNVSWTNKGQSSLLPPVATVGLADVAKYNPTAKQYLGMIIKVENVTVGEPLANSSNQPTGFVISASSLRVSTDLYDFLGGKAAIAGTTYRSITGVLHYGANEYVLLVRQASDLNKGAIAAR